MHRTICAAIIVLGFYCPLVVEAANWLEFRGTAGQGHASVSGLPVEWSDSENIVWKQPIPGEGWSSPVLYAGRIYLTAAIPVEVTEEQTEDKADASLKEKVEKKPDAPANQKKGGTKPKKKPRPPAVPMTLHTLCLDAKSGKILWNVELFESSQVRIHGKNSHASPTALVQDGKIYVHFGHDGTACLDLDGKVVWKNDRVKYAPVHGNGGSPILAGDALIFSCDGRENPFVIALDKYTGKQMWRTERVVEGARKFSFTTPLLITVSGEPQVVSPGTDSICAYDPKTGREIWKIKYTGYSVIPRPVYGHGLIFFSTGYNTPSVMAIRPDGEGDVTDTHVAWTMKKGAPHTPSLLLVDDELYMVSDRGIGSCVDAKTGEVHWQERIGGNFSASPIYSEGKIYFQSEQGVGTVVEARKEFKKLATNDLKERTLASYAADDATLYIRSDKHLFRVQAQ